MEENIKALVDGAQKIVILQADNPDADSLGSALALEQILGNMGKDVYLYCSMDTPTYLRYLSGWDRINLDIPSQFDLGIIVDASTMTLFEKLSNSGQLGWVSSKPCIVLDHHGATDESITFATASLIDPSVSSTGELIYALAQKVGWSVDVTAASYIMTAILGDTQGLTNDLAKANTYHVMAELTELGVSRPELEDLRREASKMDPLIFRYKAQLIDRTELLHDGQIALVTIPQAEINTYSPLYNPAPLIQNDILQTLGVRIAIVMKHYTDGKILASIRCNSGATIAAELAIHFGGGGHPYAAGFKVLGSKSFDEVKTECISYTSELLDNLEKSDDETA